MMNKKCAPFCASLTALLLSVLIFLTACGARSGGNTQTGGRTEDSSSTQTQAIPDDGVRRVNISELQSLLEKNEAVVVDVRGSVEYKLGHIKGALSVPLGLIAQQLKDLPRDKLIVTYCA
jgi:predicted sulfurtransferase